MLSIKDKQELKDKCTTCAEQCSDHGGGRPFKNGCLCNDGEFVECKKDED